MSLTKSIILFMCALALLSLGMGAPWWYLPLFIAVIVALFWCVSELNSGPPEDPRK
jgi:hypothetical protein